MSKITLRIPTEQYAYVEIELEQKGEEPSPEELRDIHDGYMLAFKVQPTNSLPSKDWNTALDSYINGNPMDSNTYYAMSPEQQRVIQEIKKAMKRLKTKNGETEIE